MTLSNHLKSEKLSSGRKVFIYFFRGKDEERKNANDIFEIFD